jgi:hypothetical protein
MRQGIGCPARRRIPDRCWHQSLACLVLASGLSMRNSESSVSVKKKPAIVPASSEPRATRRKRRGNYRLARSLTLPIFSIVSVLPFESTLRKLLFILYDDGDFL